MTAPRVPSREEVLFQLEQRRNWGRWGEDDQLGTLNLITSDKRRQAAQLVRDGRVLSLSRPLSTTVSLTNLRPAQRYTYWLDMPWAAPDQPGGAALDFYGMDYHGHAVTHLDALGHNWDREGMWNGRRPQDCVTPQGLSWGDVEQIRDGIVTRGVLLDIPRHRQVACVTPKEPVHGWELEAAAARQGVTLQSGDALVVRMGYEAWAEANPHWMPHEGSPGMHASCLELLRDRDVAVLAWDFLDATPNEYGLPWTVHGALFAFGLPIVDNCALGPLADVLADQRRSDFMFVTAPLRVPGGTGSPVNPLAVL